MPSVAPQMTIDDAIEQFDDLVGNASERIQEILRTETERLFRCVKHPLRFATGTLSAQGVQMVNTSHMDGLIIHSSPRQHNELIAIDRFGKIYRFEELWCRYGVYPNLATMQEVAAVDYVALGKSALQDIKRAYARESD